MRSRRFSAWLLILGMLASACTTDVGASPAPASSSASAAPSVVVETPRPASPAPPAPTAATSSPSPDAAWILYDPELDAPAAIEAALADARSNGKRVLIDFGADWCPDCHVLDSFFEDPRAKAILDASYHVVRVDVGFFDKNLETAEKYGNVIGVGIPSVVILDADGTKLVDTAAGELADSSRYTVVEVVEFLDSWAT
jgi:thiol:disulfide interchange protein